ENFLQLGDAWPLACAINFDGRLIVNSQSQITCNAKINASAQIFRADDLCASRATALSAPRRETEEFRSRFIGDESPRDETAAAVDFDGDERDAAGAAGDGRCDDQMFAIVEGDLLADGFRECRIDGLGDFSRSNYDRRMRGVAAQINLFDLP